MKNTISYFLSISLLLFSHSYHLQASRDIHPSIMLDPSPNYNSPKFRSRNQSYMRAVSTLSQASCVSQVSQVSVSSSTNRDAAFDSHCRKGPPIFERFFPFHQCMPSVSCRLSSYRITYFITADTFIHKGLRIRIMVT